MERYDICVIGAGAGGLIVTYIAGHYFDPLLFSKRTRWIVSKLMQYF